MVVSVWGIHSLVAFVGVKAMELLLVPLQNWKDSNSIVLLVVVLKVSRLHVAEPPAIRSIIGRLGLNEY